MHLVRKVVPDILYVHAMVRQQSILMQIYNVKIIEWGEKNMVPMFEPTTYKLSYCDHGPESPGFLDSQYHHL